MPDGGFGTLSLLEDENYPKYWRYTWGAAVMGLDPDTSEYSSYADTFGSNNAASLYAATVNASPHAGKVALDPTTIIDEDRITAVGTALDSLFMTAGAPDPAGHVSDAVTNALAHYASMEMDEFDPAIEIAGDLQTIGAAYDTYVASPSEVDALVDAIDEASKRHYLRDVARVTAGMFDVRAVMGTQLGFMVGNLENVRASEAAEAEARLRAITLREKGAHVTTLAGQVLDARLQTVVRMNQLKGMFVLEALNQELGQTTILLNAMGQLADMQFKYDATIYAASQDKITFDIEQAVHDKLWNWEMFSYFHQAVSMHGNTMPLPRAQTPMERIGASLMAGVATGGAAGVLTGNPAIGIAAGLATAGLQLITAPWKF